LHTTQQATRLSMIIPWFVHVKYLNGLGQK
jgi:hypothetical protein